MITLQLSIVCLTVLAVAGLAAWIVARQDGRAQSDAAAAELADAVRALELAATALTPAPVAVGARVTVVTAKPDDRSITGIIGGEWPDRVRLVDAHYVTPQGLQPVPGGVVSIPKASEALRQEHGA